MGGGRQAWGALQRIICPHVRQCARASALGAGITDWVGMCNMVGALSLLGIVYSSLHSRLRCFVVVRVQDADTRTRKD